MKQVLVFSFLFSFLVLWVQESNWNAIDNFKSQEYEMIFNSDNIFLEWENKKIIEAWQKANLFKSIRSSIAEKRVEAQEKKEEVEREIFSLELALASLEWDIKRNIDYIAELNWEVVKVSSTIKKTKWTIEFMKAKVEKSEENLKKYISHIYAKSNTLYNWNEVDNLKAILLSWKDIWELLSDSHYKTLIQVTGKKLLDQHRSYLRDLYIKKVELERNQKELSTLRKQEIITKKELAEKKKLQEKYIEISKGEQAAYEKYIKEKIAIEQDLKDKQLEEEFKFEQIQKNLLWSHDCEYVNIETQTDAEDFLTEKCFNLNKAIYAESLLKDEDTDGTNYLSWPIPPTLGISAQFNDANYIAYLGTDHGAIDLPVNQWTDLKAAADGYVLYILPPETEEYAYIALKHANWYVTVYGHVTEVLFEKYDFVKRGEVFAVSWGTPGTLGAGYLSTWAHLHFETFFEKELTDPLQFLDLSVLSIGNIPKKYIYKYHGDFKASKWYEYEWDEEPDNVFTLSWDNEISRQKNLLEKYAASEFKSWEVWVEESIDGWIDPTFTMCIGLAETSLWRNLKTPFNIGNVWNTDSGATITFSTARAWIHSMIKWLNNSYLWDYDEIRLLSRYWNKDLSKPIYASSPDHWHNNIIKCMSAIKGEFVPDDYNFRIR